MPTTRPRCSFGDEHHLRNHQGAGDHDPDADVHGGQHEPGRGPLACGAGSSAQERRLTAWSGPRNPGTPSLRRPREPDMKAILLVTGSGPLLIVTSYGSAGTVNLIGCSRDKAHEGRSHEGLCPSGHAGDLGPGLKGLGSGGSILGGGAVIAAEMEQVIDLIVSREEALGLVS